MGLSVADSYWNDFISSHGFDEDARCAGDIKFEANGIINDEKVSLILSGKKTAMFSTFVSYSIDGEPIPVTGEYYMVFDRANNPRCIIELENVSIIPFNEVTWGMAKLEGEDEDLESWKEKEQEYLEEEGSIVGFDFTPDIKLIFQIFRVVYQ